MNQSPWMWYPFDFEIWLGERLLTRRDERGAIIPPYWRLDSHFHNIRFSRTVDLTQEETITVEGQGTYSMKIGAQHHAQSSAYQLPAGKYELLFEVYSPDLLPALKISGKTICSGTEWEVQNGDLNFLKPDCGETPPNDFPFQLQSLTPTKIGKNLWDFGKETFGYLQIHAPKCSGEVTVCYGESLEEAMAEDTCETLDRASLAAGENWTCPHSRACRFVRICPDTADVGDVSLLYEYVPLNLRGSFRSSDERLNRIWDVAQYTLHLNTREFFLDGIKRDRWVWGGDAYQSCLMNYYTFFDPAVCRRTLILLAGKAPYDNHVNHIPDYTFYWFITLYDYYLYTGDLDFVRKCFSRAEALMALCLSRRNEQGYLIGKGLDWLFIDWADMDKFGVLGAEQVLFLKSLEIMETLSSLTGLGDSASYHETAEQLRSAIRRDFWTEEEGFRHSLHPHKPTKYANIFALMYGYLNGDDLKTAVEKSLKNPDVMRITTPYAQFYELDALCRTGDRDYVLSEIKRYWGDMLDLGATTFWEEYKEHLHGAEHYAMYGRPFGKSLCHAWGASPLYLLGRYFLGVHPTAPGYETYEITPYRGELEFVEGAVPTPKGDLFVSLRADGLQVKGLPGARGVVRFAAPRALTDSRLRLAEDGLYELDLNDDQKIEILFS